MKKAIVCLVLFVCSNAAAAPMSKVLGIRDSRTILIQTAGVLSTVTLANVSIAPDEEALAADYLRRTIGNAWVLVDRGDVYRSPDALYVNGDLNRHPWRTMRYLGELDLGPRAKGQPAGNAIRDATLPAPPKQWAPKPIRVTSRPKKK